MSAGLPCGAPASTQALIVAMSPSDSDRLFLNSWMPTFRSMCQGGISRAATRDLIRRAHGRVSSYVCSDIGADCPGLWQVTQDRCRIGATSFVKVAVVCARVCAESGAASSTTAVTPPKSDAAWIRRRLQEPLLTADLQLMPSFSLGDVGDFPERLG